MLEHVLQGQLDQAGVYRSAGDLAEVGRRSVVQSWISKLRVIEEVEKLRAELQHGVFVNTSYPSRLRHVSVEIKLAWAQHDSHARVAVPGAARSRDARGGADDRRAGESGRVDITRPTTRAAEPGPHPP